MARCNECNEDGECYCSVVGVENEDGTGVLVEGSGSPADPYIVSLVLPEPIAVDSFTLAGDDGTAQTIATGDTVSIVGAAGGHITTTAVATDTIEIDFDEHFTVSQSTQQVNAGSLAAAGTLVVGSGVASFTINNPSTVRPFVTQISMTTQHTIGCGTSSTSRGNGDGTLSTGVPVVRTQGAASAADVTGITGGFNESSSTYYESLTIAAGSSQLVSGVASTTLQVLATGGSPTGSVASRVNLSHIGSTT